MWHGTTILSIRKNNQVVVIGDGQVTMGNVVIKQSTNKIRKISTKTNEVICGFAGRTADAVMLFDKIEEGINACGNLKRVCVKISKDLQNNLNKPCEAMMILVDREDSLILTGLGDILSPENYIASIGSGGNFALAAAKALYKEATNLTAEEIAKKSMEIASELCIYTNNNTMMEKIEY